MPIKTDHKKLEFHFIRNDRRFKREINTIKHTLQLKLITEIKDSKILWNIILITFKVREMK